MGEWSGSCCRTGAVGESHAPECGFGATSSRGCSMDHCCIDDVANAERKEKRKEGIAAKRREEAQEEERQKEEVKKEEGKEEEAEENKRKKAWKEKRKKEWRKRHGLKPTAQVS